MASPCHSHFATLRPRSNELHFADNILEWKFLYFSNITELNCYGSYWYIYIYIFWYEISFQCYLCYTARGGKVDLFQLRLNPLLDCNETRVGFDLTTNAQYLSGHHRGRTYLHVTFSKDPFIIQSEYHGYFVTQCPPEIFHHQHKIWIWRKLRIHYCTPNTSKTKPRGYGIDESHFYTLYLNPSSDKSQNIRKLNYSLINENKPTQHWGSIISWMNVSHVLQVRLLGKWYM